MLVGWFDFCRGAEVGRPPRAREGLWSSRRSPKCHGDELTRLHFMERTQGLKP